MKLSGIDFDWVLIDELVDLKCYKQPVKCQCDGEVLGPCPGVQTCPYSGEGEEDE